MPSPADQTQLTGPLGNIQKAFEQLGNTVTNNLLSPVQLLNRELGTLAGAIEAVGVLLAAAAGPTAAILALGEALSGLVAKANPAVFQQFTLAVNDLLAVIGAALVPLFNTVFIPVIRMAADSLMQLAPAGQALAVALQPLVELIGDAFAVAVGILAEAIKAISPVVMAFARILNDVVRFIGRQIRELLALIGINLPEFGGKPGASVGAAVRQAGHTSVEDVVKQAQRASFSLGTAANDPMGQMANMAKEIKARADEIYKFLQDLPDLIGAYIAELPGEIWEFIKTLPAEFERLFHQGEKGFGDVASGKQEPGSIQDDVFKFGHDFIKDSWVGRQTAKPGVFGFTSFNPFS